MKARIQYNNGYLIISKENNSPMLLLEFLAFTDIKILKVIDEKDGLLKIKFNGLRINYVDARNYINANL